MAKLGLIFICVFFIVELTLAARIVRDAPAVTPTPADGSNSNLNLNEILTNISQGIQKTLSKDNLNKIMENFGEAGEKLKEIGQTLINKAQETAADLANSTAAKKDEKST